MRNKYPGTCYRCGKRVEKGEGHFERYRGERCGGTLEPKPPRRP